jgi:hypothetical protein
MDIFDEKGQRHTPKEWFIAPLGIIEKAIKMIINGYITDFKYSPLTEEIIHK